MIGTQERRLAPLIAVSLEELVAPADHFYRHLERTLGLSFGRELVQQTCVGGGRLSLDPVVFWHRCNSPSAHRDTCYERGIPDGTSHSDLTIISQQSLLVCIEHDGCPME